MPSPTIRVDTDFSEIEADAKKLRHSVNGGNAMLNGAEVGIDVKSVESDLASPETQAAKVVDELDKVSSAGKRAGTEADLLNATSALGEATKSSRLARTGS